MTEYNNPVAVVVGIIPTTCSERLRLLGIIRGKPGDSGYGAIALPGGFVDPGESLEEAVAREIKQEVGFETKASSWDLLYSRHVPAKNINLVFCLYRDYVRTDVLADAKPNEEVSGFSYIDDTTKLAFPLHEEAVHQYYDIYQWRDL
jgi:ADP-ribose pyrophosphatase YjhB (NUDIX family)